MIIIQKEEAIASSFFCDFVKKDVSLAKNYKNFFYEEKFTTLFCIIVC